MAEYDYKSNSHKSKEAAVVNQSGKKPEKAIAGTARVKQHGNPAKLRDIFLADDLANVGSYLLMDVLVPAAKSAITDIVTNGVSMLLYGDTKARNSSNSNVPYVSYRAYSSRNNDRPRNSRSGIRNLKDVYFDSRDEAEAVIDRMNEILDQYPTVSIADFYDVSGLSRMSSYPDNDYGWKNIDDARVMHTRDGYTIEFPRAITIR